MAPQMTVSTIIGPYRGQMLADPHGQP